MFLLDAKNNKQSVTQAKRSSLSTYNDGKENKKM